MTLDRTPELVLACGARRADRGHDPTARGVQVLVARAARAQRELLDPIAAEARVRVAVDQSRHRAETAAVELLDVVVERVEVSHATDAGDDALLAEDVRVLEDVDAPECCAAQGRVAPGRSRQLHEVTDQQATPPAVAAHSPCTRCRIGTS